MDLQGFYGSFYQQPLLLAVPTLVWLALLCFRLRPTGPTDPMGQTWKYCTVFASLSVLDAFLTANDVFGLGPLPSAAAAVVPIAFVILGDFRVFLWLYPQASGTQQSGRTSHRRWLTCLALSLVVPLASIALRSQLPASWTEIPRVLFLVYELLFLIFFALVSARFAGEKRLLNAYSSYVFTYYALWAAADLWLLASNATSNAAWTLRITANLMYYVGWTPWVYFTHRRHNLSQLSPLDSRLF